MSAVLVLTPPRAKQKPTMVAVLWCECGRYHEVQVTMVREGCPASCTASGPHDEPRLDFVLPPSCSCGRCLDTYERIVEVQDTAEYVFTYGYPLEVA